MTDIVDENIRGESFETDANEKVSPALDEKNVVDDSSLSTVKQSIGESVISSSEAETNCKRDSIAQSGADITANNKVNETTSLNIDGLSESKVYELALRGINSNTTRDDTGNDAAAAAADDDDDIHCVRVSRLDELCVECIAANFNENPMIDEIPHEYIRSVLSRIDKSAVQLTTASKHVSSQLFWHYMAEHWPNNDIAQCGFSWKRLFFEKKLRELLECYHSSHTSMNYDELMKKVEAACPYTHSLCLRELRSHLNLNQVLHNFTNLTSLDISYGAPNLGMNYDQAEFGMKLADANNLAELLTHTQSISHLTLQECLLDDDLITVLMRGFSSNYTITCLDLSHNEIGDEGALKLAELLQQENVLISLNLTDNKIGDKGVCALGKSLQSNTTLHELSLRLNTVDDEGAETFFTSLSQYSKLQSINFSSNNLACKSGDALVALIRRTTALVNVDVSNNNISISGGVHELHKALVENTSIKSFDIRHNQSIDDVSEESIARMLFERQIEAERERRIKPNTDISSL